MTNNSDKDSDNFNYRKTNPFIIYTTLGIFLGTFASTMYHLGSQKSASFLNSKSKRSISSVMNDSEISLEAREYIEEVKKINSSALLNNLIEKHITILEKSDLDKLPSDYKLMTSYLYPLRSFRGFGFRIMGLVENKKKLFGNDKELSYNQGIVRNVLISEIQNLATHLTTYYPGFGGVLLDWITLPTEAMTQDFHHMQDIQNFAMNELYPSLDKTLTLVRNLNTSFESPINFDASMILNEKNVTPGRKIYHVYPHLMTLLRADLEKKMHDLIVFSQYNRNDFISYRYNENKSFVGISNTQSKMGLPKSESTKNLLKWPKLYTYQKINRDIPEGYESWMAVAYNHLKNRADLERLSFDQMKEARSFMSAEEAKNAILNPYIESYFGARTYSSLDRRVDMVNEEEAILRSVTTGKIVKVNLPNFYKNPPNDLKSFLPTDFEKQMRKRFEYKGHELTNYRYGMPTGFNTKEWAKYFPSVKTNDDVFEVARVLSQNFETPIMSEIVSRFVEVTK